MPIPKYTHPKTWNNRPKVLDRTWEWDEVKDIIDGDMWAAICGHINNVESLYDKTYEILHEMYPDYFPKEGEK